jgi:uncharacterized membrane protein
VTLTAHTLIVVAQTASRAAAPGHERGGAPHALVDLFVRWATVAFELAGVAVIVVGTLWAVGAFAFGKAARGEGGNARYHQFRADLGRAILLGLELLVAADIISTVAVDPTLASVAVLGLIVLIRTFLSFSLEVEIDGRWPWQHGDKRQGETP